MKNHAFAVMLLVALLFAAITPAFGQGAVSLSIDDLQFPNFPQSQAFVTVRDANGIPVAGIQAAQFEMVEDGQATFPPSEAVAQTNPAAIMSAVLVIDISGSMRGKAVEEAQRAANAFIDRLSNQDRLGLVAFADQVELDANKLAEGKEVAITADKNAVRNVVNFLSTKIGWDTPLYDAVYKGIELVSQEPVGKRAVIVMTDGRDERDNAQGTAVPDKGSLMKADDPINEAAKLSIPVFSIGLGAKIDGTYLSRLALRTGGTYHQAPKAEDLTGLFQQVVDLFKQQYRLTYTSTLKQDANPHSLMVRVRLPQGQAFDETKLQFGSEPIPAMPVSIAATPTSQIIAQAIVDPTPEAEATADSEGIVDKIKDTFADKPAVAIGIGVGVLLLLGLIVALIVVMIRGRRAGPEPAAQVELPEAVAPAAEWRPSATGGPATPAVWDADLGKTEAAGPGWAAAGQEAPPFVPPAPGIPIGSAGAAAGGTRVIERAPKHLGLLVDKVRPTRKYDLKGTTNVGRAGDNQVIVEDPTVSRHHAWIKEKEGDYTVFDVGSANGTYVNGEKVVDPRTLQNGDVIRFGDVEFVFSKVF